MSSGQRHNATKTHHHIATPFSKKSMNMHEKRRRRRRRTVKRKMNSSAFYYCFRLMEKRFRWKFLSTESRCWNVGSANIPVFSQKSIVNAYTRCDMQWSDSIQFIFSHFRCWCFLLPSLSLSLRLLFHLVDMKLVIWDKMKISRCALDAILLFHEKNGRNPGRVQHTEEIDSIELFRFGEKAI